ncbi:hypothetical protein [Luteithermobacter gelatinilyticus]|uniref:hypothetical protein n=1 Tax=Luteithermobacter gelatinilyticus TaxID=2582913 RepID=UPI00110733AA|nr:hypothetical protein [Luteithermobacter gelatinilyticus]|tara:strand:+ start:14938 stop:15579 length:642 start_codon:yes stop_codon:yes gene_type:complete
MLEKLYNTKVLGIILAISAGGVLGACSRDAQQGWPALQADRTWQEIEAERQKPLTPESAPAPKEDVLASAPDVSAPQMVAEESLQEYETTFQNLSGELDRFRQDLIQMLKTYEEASGGTADDSAQQRAARRGELWRGAQLALSRLMDRENRLEKLIVELQDIHVRLRQPPKTTADKAPTPHHRLEELLDRARLEQRHTDALIRRAQESLGLSP